jgi:polyvinyl alcohol dehydrogenase (cytochrome)
MTSTDEMQSRDGPTIDVDKHPGKALFQENCAGCHNGGVPKAPQQVWLEMMAPDAILAAMNGGIMSQQSAHLSSLQRQQVAEYLTRTPLAEYKAPAPPASCDAQHARFDTGSTPAKIGWGHNNNRYVSAQQAGLTKEQVLKGLGLSLPSAGVRCLSEAKTAQFTRSTSKRAVCVGLSAHPLKCALPSL